MILTEETGRIFMQKYGKRVKKISELLKVEEDSEILLKLAEELKEILDKFEEEMK